MEKFLKLQIEAIRELADKTDDTNKLFYYLGEISGLERALSYLKESHIWEGGV